MPYKLGKNWIGQIRKNGVKKKKEFPTKTEALNWESAQRQEKNQQEEKIDTIFLLSWAENYLDYVQVRFTKVTYEEKQRVFKNFFTVVRPNQEVGLLTSGQVLSHLQKQAKIRSGYSANKDRKNLVAAWNWGMKYMGLPSPNPCLVERFPEERQVRYVPPQVDFWKIYDQAWSYQDEVMLLAYLHLAARRSELFVLRWIDVDFSESKARLYTRKRKDGSLEYDWLPMTEDLQGALLNLSQNHSSEWVFPDPKTGKPYLYRQKWLTELCLKAKVKKFGLHAIRHLTASILAQANVSMIDIQAILRHKNLSTTERYIRRISEFRTALSVLPGRKSPLKQEKALARTMASLKIFGVTN